MILHNKITLGSLFDGIGAVPYVASFFGIKTLWASEILPNAISVTRRHFPNMEHLGDVTKLDGGKIPPVDIIAFGSPCQSWSVAGNRLGLEGKSGLFMEAIRIIREMRKATNGKYPQIALFENVTGLLNCGAGGRSNYQAVLEAFCETEIPMPESGRWANAGMVRGRGIDLAWIVKDSQYHRTAQRRKRLFVIVDFTGQRAGEILFISKSLSRYFAAREGEGQGTSPDAENGAGSTGEHGHIGFDGYNSDTTGNLAATLGVNCGMSTGRNGVLQNRGVSAAFMAGQAKNARSIAYSETLSPTLKGSPSGLNQMPCICEPAVYGICSDKSNSMLSGNPHSGIYKAESCRTLDQNCGNPGCNQGGMVVVEPLAVINDQGGNSISFEKEDISPTLRSQTHGNLPIVCSAYMAGHDSSLCDNANIAETPPGTAAMNLHEECIEAYGFDLQQITSKTNRSTLKKVQPSLCSAGNPHIVRMDYIVRRLTPTEAERLMSLPDDWTKYGYDGKLMSDTARYQMCGNSIVANVLAYIMQNVSVQLNGSVVS